LLEFYGLSDVRTRRSRELLNHHMQNLDAPGDMYTNDVRGQPH
jgi:hypothetical protein